MAAIIKRTECSILLHSPRDRSGADKVVAMPKATFRELAMAVSQNNLELANTQLQELIGLPPDECTTAIAFFQKALLQPGFLPKAMGLRTAVESGTDQEIGDILVLCFGLDDRQRAIAVARTRENYPRAS